MNVMLSLLVGLLIVLAFVGTFTCESLRCFSRSRLDEACWRIGRRDRLSVVLRRSTEALLAAQSVTVVLVVILAAIAGVRVVSELSNDAGPSRWVGTVAEPLVLLAGFVLLFFLLPWCLARVTGERFLARAWPALETLVRLTRPYVAVARRFDAFLHRLWGVKEPGENKIESLTREIKSVVELGQREGIWPRSRGG